MHPDVSFYSVLARSRRVLISIFLLLLLGAGFVLVSRKAGAATVWTVSNGSPGACTIGDPNCATISAAVVAASSGDTINVTAGVYPESNIIVDKNLTINGASALTTIVDGQQANRVFDVGSVSVSISGLSIINGFTFSGNSEVLNAENGGGIRNIGTLTINNCTIRANQTGDGGNFVGVPSEPDKSSKSTNLVFGFGGLGGSGAGIYNTGVLTVTNSTISGNKTGKGGSGLNGGGTGGDGGGIYNSGIATVTNSTISGNTTGDGGPLASPSPPPDLSADSPSPALIAVAGNGGEGGGIFNGSSGSFNLRNSTVAFNQTGIGGSGPPPPVTGSTRKSHHAVPVLAPGDGLGGNGGGAYTGTTCATFSVKSSLIAGNSVGAGGVGPDFFSDTSVASQGFNLVGKTDGSSGWIASDQTGTIAAPLDPLFNGGLQNNGGPTDTISLQANSPAVDKGINSFALAFDQRGSGFQRTFNNPGIGNGTGDGTDVGAFEVQLPPGPCNPDVTKPVMTCPGSVTKYTDSGQATANINLSTPPASDNCELKSVVGTRSDGKALNAPYPLGLTIVTWTATDASNNTTVCTQTIVVMSPSSRKVSSNP